MLDTLDDVFWMLPISSKKQSHFVRQKTNILDEDWQRRREHICAEYRLPDALPQLLKGWKEWICRESFLQRREAATARSMFMEVLPVYDK
jgi:hypothetical protein